MPAIPKPKHRRSKPKEKIRNEFSPKVRAEIANRSQGICEYCGKQVATEMHHVVFKSAGGRGVATNGMHMCNGCHKLPHKSIKIRRKLEDLYRSLYGENYYKDEWDV